MPRSNKCIFCDGKPLSKEHVLGRWLTPVVATPPQGKKMFIDTERLGDSGTLVRQDRRFPRELDVQVRCVCRACNSGWMSRLEDEVRPIIESLQTLSESTVAQENQSLLAKWATKTAIIARYFGSDHEVPAQYRRWFYEHQTVPSNTFVWIGTYDDQLVASMQTKDIFFHDLNGEALSFPHSQFVVFTTGCLLVCVLTAYIKNRVSVASKGLIREHLQIISPCNSDIAWPLNPVDNARRFAIFDSHWEGQLSLELSQLDSYPPN